MDEAELYRRRLAARHVGLRRLKVTNVRCICGENDPVCFEADHLYRRENDPTCWGICVNCHRKRTARGQSEHPPVRPAPINQFERLGHMLLGVCDYLTFIAGHLREAAEIMFKLAGKGIGLEG